MFKTRYYKLIASSYRRLSYRLKIFQMRLTLCEFRRHVADIVVLYDFINGLIIKYIYILKILAVVVNHIAKRNDFFLCHQIFLNKIFI